MNRHLFFIEDERWLQNKLRLQKYFDSLEPKHIITSSLGIPLKYSGYFAMKPCNLDLDAHLSKYPVTDYMFVKDNNGVIRSVTKYGGVGSSLRFDRDRLIYIIGLISSIPAHNKDSINDAGYVVINSKLIRNFFKDYLSYLHYLIQTGVLCSDNQYITGKKSIGYKFTEKYANAPFERYEYPAFLNNTVEAKPFQETLYDEKSGTFITNPITEFPYLSYWYSTKKLQIDKDRAISFAQKVLHEKITRGHASWDVNKDKTHGRYVVRKNPYSQYHAALHNINSIEIGSYKVSIDSNVHRLHSVITNMQKQYRKFLNYDGHEMVNIDISNSQSYLLCLLLNPLFWDKDSDIVLHIGMLAPNTQEKFSEEQLAGIKKYVSTLDRKTLSQYIETASNGLGYEYMMEVINKRKGIKLERDDIKTMILTTLFSKNRYMPQYKKYFAENFPQIYGLIELIKKEDYTALACLLQNIESEIILHRCCSAIWNEGRQQVPVFTIHDSICTTKGNEGLVQKIMSNVLEENIGVTPTIKVEIML